MNEKIVLPLAMWAVATTIYRLCNHGLAPNAKRQQLFRYFMASICGSVPMLVGDARLVQPSVLLALATSFLWMLTYPLCYHLTNRKSSPDYDNQMDIAFGLYIFGWVTGLMILLPMLGLLWGIVILCLLIVPVLQWIYYITCQAAIDASGMKMLQETHYNEIIEFIHSYSIIRSLLIALAITALIVGCIYIPTAFPIEPQVSQWWKIAIIAATTIFISAYVWKPNHGVFVRTGIVQLFKIVSDYIKNNSTYIEKQQERLKSLNVTPFSTLSSPHTIFMVIGESASRDFMSAFVDMKENTTPWLKELSKSEHCHIFKNAYSCDIQTVPTLEKALTEYNQYDGGQFYTSCSIVDIAHKLGYTVHWYSNQGHLGAADTPITLVANTSEVAKWTKQELNKPQYDETLIDFLDEIDPNKDNLVVLHLKGSHFNYENRFKEATRQWGEPRSHDQIPNYKNTLFYTDSVLKRAFEYGVGKLNLQAMVYFSDHADVPDRHRQPNFGNFRDTHIPLAIWLSDEYAKTRPHREQALKDNIHCYWTNDLAYDLMCGIFDIESNHFREENSIASPKYKFTREMLTAMNGKIKIIDDNETNVIK